MSNETALQELVNKHMPDLEFMFKDDRSYSYALMRSYNKFISYSIDQIENAVRVYRKCGGANNV